MNSGLYTAVSGLRSQMNALELISNNLANINTAGFKEQKAFFSLLNETLSSKDAKNLNSVINNHSVLANSVLNLAEGSLSTTGRDLDVALDGEGFLEVATPQGNRYTRNGNLTINQKSILTSRDGYAVLGENGPISLGLGKIDISQDGEIYQDEVLIDRLKVVTFDNPLTLRKEGNSLLVPTDSNAIPKPASNVTVRQGSLEQSNVNPILATVRMVEVLRHFEAIQKSVNLIMNDMNAKSIERLAR